jgi:hypothetical protein
MKKIQKIKQKTKFIETESKALEKFPTLLKSNNKKKSRKILTTTVIPNKKIKTNKLKLLIMLHPIKISLVNRNL